MNQPNKPSEAITSEETSICISDIRSKLSALDDKALAVEILDNLSKLENQIADKTSIIAKLTLRETNLLDQNNKLFARVTQINDQPKPGVGVNYSTIDRTESTIIDNI